jgi:hypothetical protein
VVPPFCHAQQQDLARPLFKFALLSSAIFWYAHFKALLRTGNLTLGDLGIAKR